MRSDVLLRAIAKSRCRGPSSVQLEDGGKYTAAARLGAGAHSFRASLMAPARTSNPSVPVRNEDRMRKHEPSDVPGASSVLARAR